MTSFPNSPKLLKGAIIGFDIANPFASIVVFQYNPETLTRQMKGIRRRRCDWPGRRRSESG